MDEITNLTEESSGERYADTFWQLPSREDYPSYYVAIKEPRCLMQLSVLFFIFGSSTQADQRRCSKM